MPKIVIRTPPEPKATDKPLRRFQFKALLNIIKLDMADLEAAIRSMPLPDDEIAISVARLYEAEDYIRSHPLVERVRQTIGMPVDELDAHWLAAAALK